MRSAGGWSDGPWRRICGLIMPSRPCRWRSWRVARRQAASSITPIAACSMPAASTRTLLEMHDIARSMGRIGNPYDNAKAQSFMKTLKQEEVDGRNYRDLKQAREAIGVFIEDVYNRQRLHSALGYRPPAEFEANVPRPTYPRSYQHAAPPTTDATSSLRLGPRPLARIVQALSQQKRRYLLALASQILHRHFTRPREITHRLVTRVGNPDRREIASAQLLDQTDRIAPVGLYPLARLLQNERGRYHNALVPKALDLPVEPISGRPCLVAERQPPILSGKLPHHLRDRRLGVLDLAQKPNFTSPTSFRNRNRITQLGCIKSHGSFDNIGHDSPSLLEALPGLSG